MSKGPCPQCKSPVRNLRYWLFEGKRCNDDWHGDA